MSRGLGDVYKRQTYAVNPDPVFIPPTSNDLALHQGAVYRMTFEEFFDAACRGDVDRMFLSGGQIDGWGNTNVTAIGPDPSRPKIKLGGGGGGCNISATIGALTVWTTRHRSGRTLVRDLDVLTDIGHRTPEGDRAELGYPGGGPEWLITELGVFDYVDGQARLRALWPDVTLADVELATGFDLRVDLAQGLLEPPTEAELAAVRAIDPLGVRRLEFGPDELKRTFPCAS